MLAAMGDIAVGDGNPRISASQPQEAYSSLWKTTKPVPLSREAFLDLLSGRTPLIHIPNFTTPEQSQRLADHLLPIFSPYLHATGPAVEKVGVAQFEFQAQSAEDFASRKGNGVFSKRV